MNWPRVSLASLATVLVCALGLLLPLEQGRVAKHESARLHAHFSRVLEELAHRDVSQLSALQRASRARLLALLRDYDRRGRFPRNEGHRPQRTPIFVDRHGTRCAMAHLIERSGGAALVERIADARNLARIHELSSDPGLKRWLAAAGLSLDEAARIQPAYDAGPPSNPGSSREDHVPDDDVMTTATLLTMGFGIPAIFLNVRDRPWPAKRQAAVLAVLVGAESLAMGLIDGTHDGHLRGSGYAQLVTGACALTLGILNLRDGARANRAARPEASGAVRPEFALRTGPAGETRIGLAVRF